MKADFADPKDDFDARVSDLESSDSVQEVRLASAKGGLDDVVMWQTDVSPHFDYVRRLCNRQQRSVRFLQRCRRGRRQHRAI